MSNNPRIMISAASSGSGKTIITCGIIQALLNRKLKVSSFKCGPDYIDPMFHTKILGTDSRNIDSYFSDDNTLKYLFKKTADKTDISVIEGVMGFYDGLAGTHLEASSYDISVKTKTPVILVVNTKGMSLSISALIKGFLEYRKDSRIKGVILNHTSKMMYSLLKEKIEEDLKIDVIGYVPEVEDIAFESRHLGLITPDEIENLKEKIKNFADILELTIDIDKIIAIAQSVEKLECEDIGIPKINEKVKIAVAKDNAFNFYYKDNIKLLEEMGAEIEYFSPLNDEKIPENTDGIIIGGGYPELYAFSLSSNGSMRASIKEAAEDGMPGIAECGGFMYINSELEGADGKDYEMAGVLCGKSFKTNSLSRFGYINLICEEENFLLEKNESIKGHEYHYWDCTVTGNAFTARKPYRKKSWNCIKIYKNFVCGYPHMYFYSNLKVPYKFLKKCVEYKNSRV